MKEIAKEKQVVSRMIDLYCEKIHGSKTTCPNCEKLKEYASLRLDKCPYGEKKTSCRSCKTHCYRNPEKSKIKEIMRFSGPRMLIYHPLNFLKHLTN